MQTPTEKDEMGQHDLNVLRYHNGYEILLQFNLNPGFLQSLHGYFNTIYGYICLPGACLWNALAPSLKSIYWNLNIPLISA